MGKGKKATPAGIVRVLRDTYRFGNQKLPSNRMLQERIAEYPTFTSKQHAREIANQ